MKKLYQFKIWTDDTTYHFTKVIVNSYEELKEQIEKPEVSNYMLLAVGDEEIKKEQYCKPYRLL